MKETTPAAAARAPFFEPEPVKEKKRALSTGVRDSSSSDGEEEDDGTEDVDGSDDEMDDIESEEGSISDSWDSDTEWDEEKLEEANRRKYWSR